MKKKTSWLAGLLTGAFAVSALLAGCRSTPQHPEQTREPEAVPTPQQTEEPAPYDDRRCLTSAYDESGQFTDEWGNVTDYDYHVPRLMDDTPDADAVNRELEEIYGREITQSLENMKNGYSPDFQRISWNSYWNGSLLSLVMERDFYGQIDYQTYNYDFAEGRALDHKAVLKRQQVPEESFYQALRRAAAAEQDQTAEFYSAQGYGAMLEYRSDTLSLNTYGRDLRVYLDGTGEIHGILPISVPAAGGVYEADLVPDLNPEYSAPRTARFEFVEAVCSDGSCTVRFHQTEDSDWYLPEHMDYLADWPVHGLYGDYEDVQIGIFGQDFSAYLFLLDTTGRVTFCNLLLGAQTGYLCAVGPLPELPAICSLETAEEQEGQTVYAVDGQGTRHDLAEYVTALEASETAPLIDAPWMTRDGVEALFYTDDQELLWIHPEREGDPSYYAGVPVYQGMTEEGLLYACIFTEDTDPSDMMMCTMAMRVTYGNGETSMELKLLSGDPLLGLQPGQSVEVVQP